jgi:hypothetical protein
VGSYLNNLSGVVDWRMETRPLHYVADIDFLLKLQRSELAVAFGSH